MLFDKRKKKKAQELSGKRLQVEQRFDSALRKAETLEDPAERIIALQKLSDDINAQIVGETRSIERKARSSGQQATLGSSAAVCAGGVAAAFVFTTPVGGAIILGAAGLGYLGSVIAGNVREVSVHDKLMLDATDHVINLGRTLMAANDLRDATIENNVDSISASPKREQAMALPGIAEKFSAAAAKRIVEANQAVSEEKPAEQPVAEKKEKRVPVKPLPPVLKRKNNLEK